MSNDIRQWLADLGLGEYTDVFVENEIDIEIARELTDADLKELGLLIGPRKKLLKAISSLAEDPATGFASLMFGPDSDHLGSAERRQVTVLFCDMVGSTQLSEQFDPEDLQSVLLLYQDVVLAEIAKHKGYTAHFQGDGILAYFGWPSAYEDQTANAVRAGLCAAKAVQSIATPSGEKLSSRIGIATGLVVVGDVLGKRGLVSGAITGATPNLAARIQAVAQPNQVVIEEDTRRLLGTQFHVEETGTHRLKGISQPVRTWHVISERDVEDRFDLKRSENLTALVGREEERALIRRRWAQAESGNGCVVVLSGEAGIGKSRIAKDLLDHIDNQSVVRFRFFCSADRVNSSLHPILSHLRRAAGFQPGDTDATKLERLGTLFSARAGDRANDVAVVAEALGIGPDGRHAASGLPPQHKKDLTLTTLTSIIVETSKASPVLIVLEDAHWIDPTTLELFNRTVALIPKLPVLLVVTSRPKFEPTWLDQPHVTVRLMNRLSNSDGLKIVRNQTDGMRLPEDVAEDILTKPDGIPLYIEELTRSVVENTSQIAKGDLIRTFDQTSSMFVPSTLQASLVSRLDRLGSAKSVAQIGAAIGRSFTYALVQAVASGADEHLDQALSTLMETDLVHCRGAPPNATYNFKHALIQDAAYQTLLKSRREKLHAKIASVVLEEFPSIAASNPEILALHYARARNSAAAVEYYYRASIRAVENYAHVEATHSARQALELLDELSDSEARADRELDLQVILGQASFALFGYGAEETLEAFSKAKTLMEKSGDTRHAEAISRGMIACLYNRARIEEARQIAEEYREKTLSQDGLDRVSKFSAHRAAVGTYNAMGRFADAELHGRTALKFLSNDSPNSASSGLMSDHRLSANAQMALALWHRGHCEEADTLAEASLAAARNSLNVYTRYIVLVFSGAVLSVFRHDNDGLRTPAEQLVEIAANDRAPSFEAVGSAFLGGSNIRAGHHAPGRALLDRAIELANEQGQAYFQPIYHVFYAESHLAEENPQRALEVCQDGLCLSSRTGERWMDTELLLLQASATERLGSDPKDVRGTIHQAIATAKTQGSASMERRARSMLQEAHAS